MFERISEYSASLPEQRETWEDKEVSFTAFSQERDCLFLFVVFSAVQKSDLSETEQRYLLDVFREVLHGDVRAGKVDQQVELNLQDYCDAANAPHPKHLSPLWNVGLAFARHVGAENDVMYVQSAGTTYASILISTVKLLNAVGKSYRIVKG